MKEGKKFFINKTGKNLELTIFIRSGGSPEDQGGTDSIQLTKNPSPVEYIYEGYPDELGYVYLNGFLAEWKEGSDLIGTSQRVATRGDSWDNILNTNSTITISSVSGGAITANGSN